MSESDDEDDPVTRSDLRDAYESAAEGQTRLAIWLLYYFILIQLQIVLVALKLGGAVDWSWWIITLPSSIPGLVFGFLVCAAIWWEIEALWRRSLKRRISPRRNRRRRSK